MKGYEPCGVPGELTVDGMIQHKNLGEWFRDRYIVNESLFEDKFDEKDVYVRSTSVNRCLMSAWSQMAGLFKEPNGPEGLRAVPIEVEWEGEDILLKGYKVWFAL